MVKNVVKKELYKQKPTAKFVSFTKEGGKEYSTVIYLKPEEGEEQPILIRFVIPKEELKDDTGQDIFADEMPAQLLIRWLV